MWKVCRSSILRLSVLLLYEGSGLLLRRVLVSFYIFLIQVVLAFAEKLTATAVSMQSSYVGLDSATHIWKNIFLGESLAARL